MIPLLLFCLIRRHGRRRISPKRLRAQVCAMPLLVALGVASPCFAGITTYGNGERDAWFEDVGDVGAADITTVGFNEFPPATVITDQYAHLGVTFDGNNFTIESPGIYHQDGWGLRGLLDIAFQFDSPRNAIAADYPGDIRFLLFLNDVLVGEEYFSTAEFGNFAGVISTTPFDAVVLDRFGVDLTFVDDIHFALIPTPGGMIPLLIVCLARCHRRRDERHI